MTVLDEFKKIPNLITLSRLLLIPVLLYFAYKQDKLVFGIIYIFYWLSDGIDGFIARKFKQTTKFGAKFDSFVDDFGSVFLLIDAYFLFPKLYSVYGKFVISAVALQAFTYVFRIFKAKNIGIHLVSCKIVGGLTGIVLLWTLVEFNRFLFWTWLITTYLAYIEVILVILFKDVDEETKSIFSL